MTPEPMSTGLCFICPGHMKEQRDCQKDRVLRKPTEEGQESQKVSVTDKKKKKIEQKGGVFGFLKDAIQEKTLCAMSIIKALPYITAKMVNYLAKSR